MFWDLILIIILKKCKLIFVLNSFDVKFSIKVFNENVTTAAIQPGKKRFALSICRLLSNTFI